MDLRQPIMLFLLNAVSLMDLRQPVMLFLLNAVSLMDLRQPVVLFLLNAVSLMDLRQPIMLFLLNAVSLMEKQQIPFYSLWFEQIWGQTYDLMYSRRALITPLMWLLLYHKIKTFSNLLKISTVPLKSWS